MILHHANLAIIVFVFVFVVSSVKASHKNHHHHCEQTCGIGKSTKHVPFPFGFSDGCGIRLNCTTPSTESVTIGGFQVQNITADKIFVDFPAECGRDMSSLHSLFGRNYAMTRNNSLLLQNCSSRPNDCVIPRAMVEQKFDLKLCNQSDIMTCYSPGNNMTGLLRYDDLNRTRCKFLFSSFAFNSGGDSGVSLEFQRLELDWWLPGTCNCSTNADCTPVELANSSSGFRCRCREGFHGDGFAAGNGCQKTSDCNGSNYITGRCGGNRVAALVGGLVAGALLMAGLAFICYCIRKRTTSLRNTLSAKRLLYEAAGNSSVPFFPYKEVERATNGFDETQRLGTGAYGTVYAGKLHNDEWVAVKRFRYRDTDSIDQVMNEIKLLSSVSHPNLVRLLGCCIEEGEPILVYEFMPNGTLCQHLQRERGRDRGLPWTIRLTVATETAQAIAYLHSAMNPPIYHRDIKSSNILLDYSYKSKVADFGLSRLGMTESSHISTAPQGTPGYLDPQYHQYFHLSDKSDVYSFGVVLVEIITALKVVDFTRPHSEVNLAALAIDRIGRGCIDEIIDPYLEPNRDAWTLSSIHNVAELAFRCLAFHCDMRPTMMEVAEELENIRVSAWASNLYMASPSASCCSSSDFGSERSLSGLSGKKKPVRSQRLIVPSRDAESLAKLEEVKDSSPVSVHDPWLSEQSSPSTNSLLGNVVQ